MDARFPKSRRSRVSVVTPAQIVALGLVAASIGWAAWLLRERPTADEVALLEDTTLTAPQLAAVEAALDRANLTDYRTAEGNVWVPRSRQGAYKRAVVDADAIPKPWGTRFHEAINSGGVWTSPSARAESLKVALQDELSQVLCSMPGIERAAVLYDVEERSGFQQEPLKTASVGIRTTSGTELDPVRAHGIRVLVASSIAGLDPERVAVTDLSTGRVFAGALEDPAAHASVAPELARRFANETALAGRIRQALAFVRGVIVDVAIDAPPLPTTAEAPPALIAAPAEAPVAAAANAPAELLPPAPPPSREPVAPGSPAGPARPMIVHPEIPGVVHVTVSIPDSYLAAAIAASSSRPRNATADTDVDPNADKGAEAEAEHRELERLREIVGRALPSLDSPDRLRVLVTSYPAMSPDPAERRPEALDSRRPPIDRPTAADVTIQSEVAGPASHQALPDLPREAWLAATSVLVGILAGFLWWAGSRSGGQPEESFPSWKASDDDDHTGASEERRLAA
jgi:type III secretory pathway lipoprotein EscJ